MTPPLRRLFAFYTTLAWRDTVRRPLRLAFVLAIVCGTTVPLALLLGLTDGLVRQQEDDLRKSPSAVVIHVAVTPGAKPLTPDREAELARVSGISQVIPDVTKVADLSNPASSRTVASVTLCCTKPGDPLLAFYGADVLPDAGHGVVLGRNLADELGIRYERTGQRRLLVAADQRIDLDVTRQEDAGLATAHASLPVRAVADFDTTAPIAYVHRNLVDHIEDFQHGRSVDEFGWRGYTRSAESAYEAYLSFSKTPLPTLDELKLRAHGLTATPLDASDLEHQRLRELHGLLVDHDLNVYRLHAEGAATDARGPTLVRRPADDVERITGIDDVVVVWNDPVDLDLDGTPRTVVGLTVHARWLKRYIRNSAMPFRAADDEFTVRLDEEEVHPAQVMLTLANGIRIPLHLEDATPTRDTPPTVRSDEASPFDLISTVRRFQANPSRLLRLLASSARTDMPPSIDRHTLAVVPAPLLAHVRAAERGEVEYDGATGLFVEIRPENAYYQARIVATDIHAVPLVDEFLADQGYATRSERTRVEEIQGYARTLRLLVLVVGGTSFAFGFLILAAALSQDTSHRRRSIGQLRAMGVGAMGIFYIVVVRGLLIGFLAGCVTVPAAIILGFALTLAGATCPISLAHLAFVFGLALVATVLGVLLPAASATRTPPHAVLQDAALG